MIHIASTPQEYISKLPEDRKQPMKQLCREIKANLPEGFEEAMSYNMIAYQVPLSIFPTGYHATKKKSPLPFLNLASQKNYIALYHMGLYASPELLKWFQLEYSKRAKTKLDMGKSCIRFKKMDDIPHDLIVELCGKISVEQWIKIYQEQIKR